MKKLFCLLLCLLLTGCASGKTAVTTEPTAPAAEMAAEPTTEPTAEPTLEVLFGEVPEDGEVTAEELLRKEGTVTVTFETREEYEEKLHELGYTEISMGYYLDFVNPEVFPKALTYNDEAFRLELSANCNPVVNMTTDLNTVRMYDGWILYGMKAEKAGNITGLDYEDYEYALCMDWFDDWRYDKIRDLDILPVWQRNECYDEIAWGQYSRWACHEIRYYPYTRNLYNLVKTMEGEELAEGYPGAPRMLIVWERALVEAWTDQGLPMFEIYPGYLDNNNQPVMGGDHIGLSNIEYCFEPGMTPEEWVNSGYNMDGWRYANDKLGGTLISPERNYAILLRRDGNGNLLPLDSYKTSYGTCPVIAVTYEAYKTLLDSLAAAEG